MKKCPSCNLEYRDGTMEFCLEDGTRLVFLPGGTATAEALPKRETLNRTSQETVVIPPAPHTSDTPMQRSDEVETVVGNQASFMPTAAAEKLDVLGYSSVAAALAHNWWQWLYLEKQYAYSVTAYLLSANFLMWLMLLIGGTVLGFLPCAKRKAAFHFWPWPFLQ